MTAFVTPISSSGLTLLLGAIEAAEKGFARYHGTTVRMMGVPESLDYLTALDRLNLAKYTLSTCNSQQQWDSIFSTLETTYVDMELAHGMAILSDGPAGAARVDFNESQPIVSEALIKVFGVDRRHPKPGLWRYRDPMGSPSQIVQVVATGRGLMAVFPATDWNGRGTISVDEMPGEFEQIG